MFNSLKFDRLVVDSEVYTCPESGATRATISVRKRSPSDYLVYVGHPISGIRVGRILEMQDQISSAFNQLNEGTSQSVRCLFPMRTTHLTAADIGANEYGEAEELFSNTRHFTLQNRIDAVMAADAVLVNFDLKDDDGNYRLSKGIPFDYGWASAMGKPVVTVIGDDNPNMCAAAAKASRIVGTIDEAVLTMNGLLSHVKTDFRPRVVAEVFDFTGAGAALSMIAHLAEADARKHMDGGRAIIAVIPEGRQAACWHGQVAEVADWVVDDYITAESIVARLIGAV